MSEVKIPEGYKQTEIGVIPEDWEISSIDDYSVKVGSGKTPTGGSSVYVRSGRPFIRSQNVGWGKLKLDDVVYITEEIHDTFLGSQIEESDVLLNITGASIGRCSKADNRITGGNVNQHVCLIRTDEKKLISKLLVNLINSNSGQKQIDSYQAGGNREGLNFSQVRQLRFAIPTIVKEQTAIATALSDVDNLIQSLEKLTAKKEAIKTGTMQQLLTGKTRLPEFATREDGSKKGFKQTELGRIPEDWEARTVFELAERNSSNFNDGDWVESEHIINHGIRLLQTGNIGVGYFVDKGNKKYISEHSFIQLNCKLLEVGDLLICRLAEPAGRACIFKGVEENKAITSVDVTIFRPPADSVNREFYLHVFSSSDWFNSINEQVGGTTHKRISRSALGSIYVPYPTHQEQTAIATILSDMDAEIQALQERLDKTRDIKQGMMQQLLTGKVRLVNPSDKSDTQTLASKGELQA